MGMEMGPGPEVEHHHHHQTGHRWLDITLAVSAVFISLMSLVLAIQHGHAMEKMVEVSSWPSMAVQFANAERDGTPHFSVWAVNNGVGPAKLESIEIFVEGKAQSGPSALLQSLLKGTDSERKLEFTTGDVVDMVFPARETITLLDVLPGQFTPEQVQTIRVESAKIQARVCYCSVFDECWVLDQRKSNRAEPVKACTVPKVMFGQ